MSRFTKIYSRFRKPIYRYVSTRVNDPEMAEDITQEIFIKVFRFEDRYEQKYALSTWLWAIAKNTVSDSLRDLRKSEMNDPISNEVPCERHCAETLAIHKDERKRLLKIFRPLTRLQKRVLWLRAIHHLSYQEISKKLGLSAAAAKNMASRAKQNLLQSPGWNPAWAPVA